MAGYFAKATLVGLATLPPVWGVGWLVWLLMGTPLDTESYWVSMTGVGIGWLIGWWLLKPLADFYAANSDRFHFFEKNGKKAE